MALSNFTRVDPKAHARRRLLMSVWGKPKEGKTSFALTAPSPIYFFDFDLGMEDIIHKFPDAEVFHNTYRISSLNTSIAERETVYQGFLGDLESVIGGVSSGTVVIDTAIEVWSLIQSIYVEKIRQKRKSGDVFPFDYADANQHFSEIVKRFDRNKGLNLCMIQKAREKYNSQGQKTGEFEAQQNASVEYLAQIGLHLEKTADKTFQASVEYCRHNTDIEGLTIPGANWDTIEAMIG